ncbi:hypothetical protein D3C73_1497720 [compost metagenome]
MQQALGLGVLDHRKADSVLDAARRIEIFQLSHQSGPSFRFLSKIVKLQHRSISDQIR